MSCGRTLSPWGGLTPVPLPAAACRGAELASAVWVKWGWAPSLVSYETVKVLLLLVADLPGETYMQE